MLKTEMIDKLNAQMNLELFFFPALSADERLVQLSQL